MAIQINYLDDGIGIEIVASDVVTGAEIIEAHKEIYNKKNLQKQRYQIIDRSLCKEYLVSPEEVKKIAAIDKAASRNNPDIIIALISPSSLQFGMSRMWQAYVEDSGFSTEVFHDRESAEKWLKEQLKEPDKTLEDSEK